MLIGLILAYDEARVGKRAAGRFTSRPAGRALRQA